MGVGLLTSGGDCAGLNAVIRAVVLGTRPATHSLASRSVDAIELRADGGIGALVAQEIADYHGVDPDDALVHSARGLGIAFGDRVGRD